MRVLILDREKLDGLTAAFKGADCVVLTDPEEPNAYKGYDQNKIIGLLESFDADAVIVPHEAFEKFSKAVKELNESMDFTHNITVMSSGDPKSALQANFAHATLQKIAIDHGHSLENGHLDADMNTITIDGVCLHLSKNEVKVGDKDIGLVAQEYQFLRAMMIRAGTRVEKDYNPFIHPDEEKDVDISDLKKVRISGINKKIKNAGGPSKFIENVHNRGYIVQSNIVKPDVRKQFGALRQHRDGSFTIEVKGNETPLKLAPADEKILAKLMETPETPVNCDDSSKEDTKITSHDALSTSINNLKKAIAKATECKEYQNGVDVIETVWGKGFQLRENLIAYTKKERPRPPMEPRDNGHVYVSNEIMIDTIHGKIVNTTTGKTSSLPQKLCEMIDFTFKNPGWKSINIGTPTSDQTIALNKKAAEIGLPPIILSGGRGRDSTGYHLNPKLDLARMEPALIFDIPAPALCPCPA